MPMESPAIMTAIDRKTADERMSRDMIYSLPI